MSNKLFTWTDIRRIAEHVFTDAPETETEIRKWTETLFYICSSTALIVRQLENIILADPIIRIGIAKSFQDCIEELVNTLKLFPEITFENFMNWIYENVIAANLGYIKVLSEKEIEDASKE